MDYRKIFENLLSALEAGKGLLAGIEYDTDQRAELAGAVHALQSLQREYDPNSTCEMWQIELSRRANVTKQLVENILESMRSARSDLDGDQVGLGLDSLSRARDILAQLVTAVPVMSA